MEQIGVAETLMLREFSKLIFNIGDNKMNMENFIREFKIYCETVENTRGLEKIKQYLSSDNADFTEYNDTMVRRLVEYIRVMKDKTIIIVLKGGLQIEEKLEQI